MAKILPSSFLPALAVLRNSLNSHSALAGEAEAAHKSEEPVKNLKK